MSKVSLNRAFFIGFIFGIVTIISLTFLIFFYSLCHHCVRILGFPFPFWESFAGNGYYSPESGLSFPDDFERFNIWYLVADILFNLVFSLGMGFIFKFVWSKIAARKLN